MRCSAASKVRRCFLLPKHNRYCRRCKAGSVRHHARAHRQGPVLACPGAQPGSGVPLAMASYPWPPASLRAALGAPAPSRQLRLGAPVPPALGAPAPHPQVTPVPTPLGPDLGLRGLRQPHTARSEWTHTLCQSEPSPSTAPGSSVDIRHTASLDAHCSRARLRCWPLSAPR